MRKGIGVLGIILLIIGILLAIYQTTKCVTTPMGTVCGSETPYVLPGIAISIVGICVIVYGAVKK